MHQAVGPHVWFLLLNTKEKPFNDKRVRQAVNYAVNKQALVDKVLQGSAQVADGPIPSAFTWAANKEVSPYPYDPEKARALLKEAGAEGATLNFYVTEGGSGMLDPIPMATAIQADLKAVGLNVTIQTWEWNTYLAKVNAGLTPQTQMAEMAWMTNDPDTLPFLTCGAMRGRIKAALIPVITAIPRSISCWMKPVAAATSRRAVHCIARSRPSFTMMRPGCSSPTGSKTL
ncbi:hypothetical protein ERHA55_14810 [Erwinia rhapontici]|nr:hypothetical protein ERHA55_14810 [Erwinia rhapontici]